MAKLSKRAVDAAMPRPTAYTLWDGDLKGFGLRVLPTGTKTFVAYYRKFGRQRFLKISRVGSMTPDQARTEAKRIMAAVAGGTDPAAERDLAAAALRVGDLVFQFIKAKGSGNRPRRSSTLRDYRRYLEKYLSPLHSSRIAKLTRVEIAGLIAKIERTKSPTVARSFAKALSSFLSWCVRKGLADTNVASMLDVPDPPPPRERRLTLHEIAAVWKATADDSDYSKIIRLLLLSGQRLSEIAHLSWSEIDLDKRLIIFAKERIKNRSQHIIPLSDPMFDILSGIRSRNNSNYVFGKLSTPFSGFSKGQKQLLIRLPEMPKWSPHDLRRTFQTTATDIGILPWVVSSILNHQLQGAARHYDYSTLLPQKKNALAQWAQYVLMSPEEHEKGNIIALPHK